VEEVRRQSLSGEAEVAVVEEVEEVVVAAAVAARLTSYFLASAMKSTSLANSSFGGAICRQIRSRSSRSGFVNSIARVIRRCIASSRSIGRLVARTQRPSWRSSSVSTVFTCSRGRKRGEMRGDVGLDVG
jgi:hypothetical protein